MTIGNEIIIPFTFTDFSDGGFRDKFKNPIDEALFDHKNFSIKSTTILFEKLNSFYVDTLKLEREKLSLRLYSTEDNRCKELGIMVHYKSEIIFKCKVSQVPSVCGAVLIIEESVYDYYDSLSGHFDKTYRFFMTEWFPYFFKKKLFSAVYYQAIDNQYVRTSRLREYENWKELDSFYNKASTNTITLFVCKPFET